MTGGAIRGTVDGGRLGLPRPTPRHPRGAALSGPGRARAVMLLGFALFTSGCGEGAAPLVPVLDEEVLVLTQQEGLVVFFDGRYRGMVELDDAGCLRLDLAEPDDATVVWPAGTSLWSRGDQLVLRDPAGRQIVALGENVQLGGGFLAALEEVTDLSEAERAEIRGRCPGPYWLMRPGSARRITS